MELTIQVPESLGKEIKKLSNFQELILRNLEEMVKKKPSLEADFGGKELISKTAPLSKWAKIGQRVKNDPKLQQKDVQKVLTQLEKDMKEFRENFEFEYTPQQ